MSVHDVPPLGGRSKGRVRATEVLAEVVSQISPMDEDLLNEIARMLQRVQQSRADEVTAAERLSKMERALLRRRANRCPRGIIDPVTRELIRAQKPDKLTVEAADIVADTFRTTRFRVFRIWRGFE